MGSTAGNDQNTLLYDFYAKIWNKMQENVQWFQKLSNARKTLWMAINARKFKDRNSKMCS